MKLDKILKGKIFKPQKKHNSIVYKYRMWDKIKDPHGFQRRILTDNELYLSSPDQFNDPFDSSLPFQYRKKDLKPNKIYNKMYQMSRKEWPHLTHSDRDKIIKERIASGVFTDNQYSQEWHKEFIREINEEVGIFSLSEDRSNVLMWSHYADAHKGYCIGLDFNELFEISGSIGRVRYSNKFPEIPLFSDEEVNDFMKLLTTKSKDWAYEKEIRILKRSKARKIINIPDTCIREIIFGFKMEEQSKNEIIDIVRSKTAPIEIFEATTNNQEFKLDITKKIIK